jgi:hypothetical protein
MCAVDDEWFARSQNCTILETPVKIVPLEEMIWQKSYIMERERFDGADIAHLLLKCGERIDWEHLLTRFGPDWRVLLSHLVLFGFIYPSRIGLVPAKVVEGLLRPPPLGAAERPGHQCVQRYISLQEPVYF